MTPTYTLYHGDCLDILPMLEAGSVDAVITDPPYGTTACSWDSVIPFEPMWAGIRHVLRPRGAAVLFGSQPFTSALVMSNAEWFKYEWIWDKRKGGNIFNLTSQPYKIHEDIVVFSPLAHIYNPQFTRQKIRTGKTYGIGKAMGGGNYGDLRMYESLNPKSILHFSNADQSEKTHPTQKPVALMEYLIRTYTNPGDTVLDFTMGSGTTGVACMRTGRNFIGIELDAEYYRIAETRIRNAAGEFVLTDNERERGQLPLWGCG